MVHRPSSLAEELREAKRDQVPDLTETSNALFGRHMKLAKAHVKLLPGRNRQKFSKILAADHLHACTRSRLYQAQALSFLRLTASGLSRAETSSRKRRRTLPGHSILAVVEVPSFYTHALWADNLARASAVAKCSAVSTRCLQRTQPKNQALSRDLHSQCYRSLGSRADRQCSA